MEVIKDFNVYEYFKKLAYEKQALFSIEIDVTSKCNADCIFCFQGSHNSIIDSLTKEKIIELLDDLRNMGTYYIGFSGGEPFLRKDFIDILYETRKRGFRISIITNAHFIREDDINNLSELNIDRITVSFHSINIENYLYHFGINNKKLFYNALKNIKLMINKDISLGIAVTVTNKNIDELDNIKTFFMNMGLKESDISFNMLLTGAKTIEHLRLSKDQIINNRNHLTYKDKLSANEGLLCAAGTISCCVSSNGLVYPCTFFNTPCGNLNDNRIYDIWYNSHFLKILRSFKERYFEKCYSCNNNKNCHLCLVTNINENNDVFTPSDQYCLSRKSKWEVINEFE